MLRRTALPLKRQFGLADCGIQLEEISRIYDEDEFLLVVTSALCLLCMVICTGIGQHGVACHTAQGVVPSVWQLLIGDLHRVALVENHVEMHEYFLDAIATLRG